MAYKIGDVIAYSPFGGGTRYVKVDEKSDDIKNGRPGFGGSLVKWDGTDSDEITSVWGYDSQITSVIPVVKL